MEILNKLNLTLLGSSLIKWIEKLGQGCHIIFLTNIDIYPDFFEYLIIFSSICSHSVPHILDYYKEEFYGGDSSYCQEVSNSKSQEYYETLGTTKPTP